MDPNPFWLMSLQKGEIWRQTRTQEGHHANMKAETGMKDLCAKDTKDSLLSPGARMEALNRVSHTAPLKTC